MCSETRLSRDTERGFWFVGRGNRLVGDPEEDARSREGSWPVNVLWMALTFVGDLSRVT